MKKWLVILLIAQIGSVSIFKGGIVGELLKLRFIIEHFQVHQDLENEISLLDFIAMHYGSATTHRGAHDHHEPFPFQKCSSGSTVLLAIPPLHEDELTAWPLVVSGVYCALRNEDRIQSYSGEIWLPPKLG